MLKDGEVSEFDTPLSLLQNTRSEFNQMVEKMEMLENCIKWQLKPMPVLLNGYNTCYMPAVMCNTNTHTIIYLSIFTSRYLGEFFYSITSVPQF